MELQFEDIREDTLILLIIRANETKRQNARVRDRKALEINLVVEELSEEEIRKSSASCGCFSKREISIPDLTIFFISASILSRSSRSNGFSTSKS